MASLVPSINCLFRREKPRVQSSVSKSNQTQHNDERAAAVTAAATAAAVTEQLPSDALVPTSDLDAPAPPDPLEIRPDITCRRHPLTGCLLMPAQPAPQAPQNQRPTHRHPGAAAPHTGRSAPEGSAQTLLPPLLRVSNDGVWLAVVSCL